MLDLKKYLIKVAERLHWLTQGSQYSIEMCKTENQEIAAGATKYVQVNVAKSGKKQLAITGYRVYNSATNGKGYEKCTVTYMGPEYAASFTNPYVVITNMDTSAAKVDVYLWVLYINTGGVIRNILHALASPRREATC